MFEDFSIVVLGAGDVVQHTAVVQHCAEFQELLQQITMPLFRT